MTKEIKWINCAKWLAILAVMVDHTYRILYEDDKVTITSFYSVSLFILIAGMMCYRSIERHQLGWFSTFIHSSKSMIVAYMVATFIYQLYTYRFFDLRVYLQFLFRFNVAGSFYYVCLYLQLMLVSKPLYNLLNKISGKYEYLWEMGVGCFLLAIMPFCTNQTNILNIFGGGGVLFGGTYLFLFYVGMLFVRHDVFKELSLKKSLLVTVIATVLWFAWQRFECVDRFKLDESLPFIQAKVNPPGITIFLLAIFTLLVAYGLFSLLQHIKYVSWIVDICNWLGKHTLYIFLYHQFFLSYILINYVLIDNIWIKRIVYMSVMVFGSIALEYILKGIGKVLGDGRTGFCD